MPKINQQVSYTLSEVREIIRIHAAAITNNPPEGNTIECSGTEFLSIEIIKEQTPFCTVTFNTEEKK